MTQLHRVAAVLAPLALTATACGTAGKNHVLSVQDRVQVTGAFGQKPAVRIRTPLELTTSSSWVTAPGKGDRVGPEATTILQLTMKDGRTGKTAISTYDQGGAPIEMTLGDPVFPSLARSLAGMPAGSRVVVASTAVDAHLSAGAPQLGIKGGDSVVMVADILATDPTSVLSGPTGASRQAPPTAPQLQEKDGVPSGVSFTGAHKPDQLLVIPLREGTGPVVHEPGRIAAHYLLQLWGGRRPLEENYTKEPTLYSLGLSGVVKAWDIGLAGLREGARVMLVCPPDVAYGAKAQAQIPPYSTLVFVLDVLGVG